MRNLKQFIFNFSTIIGLIVLLGACNGGNSSQVAQYNIIKATVETNAIGKPGSPLIIVNPFAIKIKFNQEVSGVNPYNMELHQTNISGPEIAIQSITPSSNEKFTYIITPAAPLTYTTVYYLALKSGIKNTSNSMTPIGFTFTTARNPIAYFVNFADAVVVKCPLDAYGVLANSCGDSGVESMPFDQPFGIAINESGTYAYITNVTQISSGPGTVTLCAINSDDGSFTNCSDSGATNISAPYGIILNESATPALAYIVDFNLENNDGSYGKVTICQINAQNGTLSNCQLNSLSNVSNPKGITFNSDKTMAYLTNHESGTANAITKCNITPTNGSLNSCTSISTGNYQLAYPFGVFLLNNIAYISSYNGSSYGNNGNASIVNCQINVDGSFSNCNQQSTSYQDYSFGPMLYNVYNGLLYTLGIEAYPPYARLFACIPTVNYFDNLFCYIGGTGLSNNPNGFNDGAIRY